MPVTSVHHDSDALTTTVVADFTAPVRRLWDAYLDPRQLERFWGPPGYPATFARHDACVGGRSEYAMTGPDGARYPAYWQWVGVDELKSFEVRDGFGDGNTPDDLPVTRLVFTFETTPGGSCVTTTSYFDSLADLEKLLAMGMVEGLTLAMGQLDAVLADLASFAAGDGTITQTLSDTQVRVSRVIRGDVDTVWRAHHEPGLLQQWLLGPDGWTMPVCEVATEVGGHYRYEWEQADGANRFGFTGVLLESSPPHRAVTSESMIGADTPATTNELTLTAIADGTLLSLVMTFPDAATRDAVLATGMTDGMETSYARLESVLG